MKKTILRITTTLVLLVSIIVNSSITTYAKPVDLPRLIDIDLNDILISYWFKDTGFNYSGKTTEGTMSVTIGMWWASDINEVQEGARGESFAYFEFLDDGTTRGKIIGFGHTTELSLIRNDKNEVYYRTKYDEDGQYYKIIDADMDYIFGFIDNLDLEHLFNNSTITNMSNTKLVIENNEYIALFEKKLPYDENDTTTIAVSIDYRENDNTDKRFQYLISYRYELKPNNVFSTSIDEIEGYTEINFEDCKETLSWSNGWYIDYFE